MVQFDRRFGSTYKGYCREAVKRDTERALDREFTGRSLRGAIDDRGVAALIFRDVEERVEAVAEEATPVAEPTERRPALESIEVEPLEIEVELAEERRADSRIELEALAEEAATPRSGRFRRWLRSLFG